MILVLFFFSHRALSIGIGRDGIGLKVVEITHTDTHSAFNVLGNDRNYSICVIIISAVSFPNY